MILKSEVNENHSLSEHFRTFKNPTQKNCWFFLNKDSTTRKRFFNGTLLYETETLNEKFDGKSLARS